MSSFSQENQIVGTQFNADQIIISDEWDSKILIDTFLLPHIEREKVSNVFVRPRGHRFAATILEELRCLWITGPAGIGKRTLAISLALRLCEQEAKHIYLIPRFVRWQQLVKTEITNAIIILADTLGAVRFERDELGKELPYLNSLLDNGNYVISTSSNDIYLTAVRENNVLNEWVNTNAKVFPLSIDNFDQRGRQRIYKNTLTYAYEVLGIISDEQFRWAKGLVSQHEKTPLKKGQRS